MLEVRTPVPSFLANAFERYVLGALSGSSVPQDHYLRAVRVVLLVPGLAAGAVGIRLGVLGPDMVGWWFCDFLTCKARQVGERPL